MSKIKRTFSPAKPIFENSQEINFLSQQKEIFETGQSVTDRIVSIDKDYIRPIVRGKEVKKVEFGAKVNMIQVDGTNFIEQLNFNPYN